MSRTITLAELHTARAVVGGAMPPTPQYAWPLLGARLGAQVWVKHENHTPTGAFKVRGGLTYLEAMRRERPHVRALVTATRGNHGQSIAFAARQHGVPVTIYVPHGNSAEKNAAMRGFGATLVEDGEDFQAAREAAYARAAAEGWEMVPSYHRDLVLGVATYAYELFHAVPDLDVLYVPIGQGSGIAACTIVRDLLGLRTRIVGVQSPGAPAYALSFAAGQVVTTGSAFSLADGMATRTPDAEALAIIRAGVLDRYAQSGRRRGRGRAGRRDAGARGQPRPQGRRGAVRREYRSGAVSGLGAGVSDPARALAEAKRALDALRPLSAGALAQLRHFYDVELTFTSNAIEGNTLTLRETAEVIEHGITVGGKPLRDHLEALDHYEAVGWMRGVAGGAAPLGEATVTELHRRIVSRSQPAIAGVYSPWPRRVAGSAAIFPNPAKLPALMAAFGEALARAHATHTAAFDAHYQLTAIHPFSGGNGRTARLLMNLILVRGGYPPVAVRPEDRARYLAALETASVRGDTGAFAALMTERLLATTQAYVAMLEEAGRA